MLGASLGAHLAVGAHHLHGLADGHQALMVLAVADHQHGADGDGLFASDGGDLVGESLGVLFLQSPVNHVDLDLVADRGDRRAAVG